MIIMPAASVNTHASGNRALRFIDVTSIGYTNFLVIIPSIRCKAPERAIRTEAYFD
jgi:hypothetical protein